MASMRKIKVVLEDLLYRVKGYENFIICKDNPLEKNLQEKNNRNRAALNALSELGFSMPAIRKALLDLNEIKLKHLSFDRDLITDASMATICRTIKGDRGNKTAQFMIAGALGLTMSELFPKDNSNNKP